MQFSTSSLVTLVTVAACLASGANAWGGLFNRFNPSMLSNLGYGGSYGKELYEARSKAPSLTENSLEEGEDEDADPCVGKTCTANEHCCDGHVCVDTEEEGQSEEFGTCLPIYGKKQGESCFKDNDCETGFLCLTDGSGVKSCQTPVAGAQELGDDCRTSSDCNLHKGLCCKLQRRARSQPKKICTYFTDPLMCVGPVSASHVRPGFAHTAGEKRVSSHPDYHHLK